MSPLRLILCCVICAACQIWTASPVVAALIIVDSFQDNLTILPLQGGIGGSQNTSGTFGDQRIYSVANTNTQSGLTIGSGLSVFTATELSTPAIVSYSLTYQDLSPSVDMGQVGAYAINLTNVQANTNWTTTIEFKGVNSATAATFVTTIASGTSNTLSILISSFVNGPIAGLGNIERIGLTFRSSNGADRSLSMSGITITAVPEPSLILLSGWPLALIALRRSWPRRSWPRRSWPRRS